MGKRFKGELSAEDMLSLSLIGAGVDFAIYRRAKSNGKRLLFSVGIFAICSISLRLTR